MKKSATLKFLIFLIIGIMLFSVLGVAVLYLGGTGTSTNTVSPQNIQITTSEGQDIQIKPVDENVGEIIELPVPTEAEVPTADTDTVPEGTIIDAPTEEEVADIAAEAAEAGELFEVEVIDAE